VGQPTQKTVADENLRTDMLLDAQNKAAQLFAEIERSGMIRAGVGEKELSDEIRDLAAEKFGVDRHWHKRIVRAGANTLQPYRQNPPDRTIASDDIVFCDFGPIFDHWEADFGRTFVLGDDAGKLALRDDLARVWTKGREFFDTHPDVTGAELFAHVVERSHDAGWEFGGPHAGHLVGEFPHESIAGDRIESYIAPGSDNPMRRTDRTGRVCHWILEVHLTDPSRGFGGFYEELLDIR
jgi:Xaa-Pro dipeptidase